MNGEMKEDWLDRVNNARRYSLKFNRFLKCGEGYKYTVNHDTEKYPSAILYGSWSVVYLQNLLNDESWLQENRLKLIDYFNATRTKDGLFFPVALSKIKYPKSKEYMQLHCYNYTIGAALTLDPNFNFESSYMDQFLKPDYLERWLDQRSLERPWEESNNIVNVASYLALQNDSGNGRGKDCLYQMLEWHNAKQNPSTGGFELFPPTRNNILQSMAGAVHNFHIHHYLNEPLNFEEKIAQNVIPYLMEGPLTACLSIDFVELACHCISYMENSRELEQALLFHLDELLQYQNEDGGWFENENASRPTTANGMREELASSNSYATWFRMCSIGMIATTLLGDDPVNWGFRGTLGMGYFKAKPFKSINNFQLDRKIIRKYKKLNLPHKLKKEAINIGVKLLR